MSGDEAGGRQEQAKGSGSDALGTNYYQEKYKHLLGGLECAKESAVRMEPNKKFGYGKKPSMSIIERSWVMFRGNLYTRTLSNLFN